MRARAPSPSAWSPTRRTWRWKNHTAGLSPPHQVQLALFEMLDTARVDRTAAERPITDRLAGLLGGLDATLPEDPLCTGYYIEIDFMSYVGRHYPAGFATFSRPTYEPADILFR